jgi:hypothetical protein
MDDQTAIPFTELPPAEPGSQIAEEWDTYRREVGRLLAEDNEGRFVLIKGGQIIGLFDECDEAEVVGARLFLLGPYLIQQIRRLEPLYLHTRYMPCRRRAPVD